ncbi:MAG: F0F1 ATP synthase subunit B [Bacteroidales bacterium]|nr:F0F1 ATP synthase subunit B [Bacteroidales bacterium]
MNNPLINPGIGVFFWMLLSFGILVFILLKFGWPVILKSLKERETAISESLHAADKARQEMAKLKSDNEQLLRDARKERDEILRAARLAKENIIEEAKVKAQQEAERIRENNAAALEYQKMEAMHDLKNQIANLSIEIAEKLIMSNLSDAKEANALIQRELDKMSLK